MKLSFSNPEVLDGLADMPAGLWPTRRRGDSRMILMVKGPREMALTAKLREEFRFYLAPVRAGSVATYGLLTAFLDDSDEPLAIRTPLFDEEITGNFLSLLSSDSFHVHFFDERDRELIGFRAENPDAHRFRAFAANLRFVSPSLAHGRQHLDGMQLWFGARSPSDDAAAFVIKMREQMFPDSLADHVDNPGEFNEPDIAAALHRTFGRDQVLLNPVRADNGREFVDVLVMTSKSLLLIQAKDSPSTEPALTRKLQRKRATSSKHVSDAARQLKGSIDHMTSEGAIEVIADGKRHAIALHGQDVFGAVIVKEVFDPDRPDCSAPVLAVSRKTGIPCLLLDHSEFQQLAFFQSQRKSWYGRFGRFFPSLDHLEKFPRSRFGLREGQTVVYEPGIADDVSDSVAHEPARSFGDGGRPLVASLSGNSADVGASGMTFQTRRGRRLAPCSRSPRGSGGQ